MQSAILFGYVGCEVERLGVILVGLTTGSAKQSTPTPFAQCSLHVDLSGPGSNKSSRSQIFQNSAL